MTSTEEHRLRADVYAGWAAESVLRGNLTVATEYAEMRLVALADARDATATLLDLRVAS